MTTLEFSRDVNAIRHRLDAVAARSWLLRVVRGGMAVLAIVATAVLAVCAAMGYWTDQPPAALRWTLLIALIAVTVGAAGWFIVRSALLRQNHAQTARMIEQAMPNLRNDLINSVLLAGDKQQASPELVELSIQEACRECLNVDLAQSISTVSLKRWAFAAVVAVAVLVAFASLQYQPFKRGLKAVLAPARYVPAANTIELLGIDPNDSTPPRFAGQPLSIVARIRNEAAMHYKAEVFIEGQPAGRAMLASEGYSVFTCPLGNADQTFRFAVRIGDSRWPADKEYYTVRVIQKVDVKGLDVAFDYPTYTGLKSQTRQNIEGPIQAPMCTRATLTLHLSSPLPSVTLDPAGVSPVAMAASADRLNFTAPLPVDKDGDYRLLMLDASGKVMQQLPDMTGDSHADAYGQSGKSMLKGYYHIHAVPDNPPDVKVLAPARDISAGAGEKVALRVRAFDEYGLTSIKLFVGPQGQEPKPVDGFSPPKITKNEMVIDYALDLSAAKKGDVIEYFATATDNRNLPIGGPQTSQTARYKITIADAADVASDKARNFEALRNRLLAMLKLQEGHRVNTEICIRKHDAYVTGDKAAEQLAKEIPALAADIATGQKTIHDGLTDLAEKFPFDEDTGPLQGLIAELARNAATQAVQQSRAMAGMKATEPIGEQGAHLAGTQDRIIDAIQRMLSIMPSIAARKSPTEHPASAPTELSPEVKDKLAKLKSDLDEKIAEQKKLVKAVENLAKKPVDNFTPEDQKALADLKASQDKWEKFLDEAFADFSKLAQQDFSNPAMLKELISVKSDITMAKDALAKKATEIATALEDNGIENAKELTANIEKWLPDKPDREKWSMEDPGNGQTNTQMPELPKELEDLVGDLLEQEEDVFDKMQDLTSKYNQSGDKGIGWDAADGPISNMNAQGVTGNQLPNSDELSGRSGEGRQGKSSGEFVEDKAVGKGGRRTPTRLTPEPFQKGQVNDQSTDDPAGGATGGGKVSGSGGEGLQGPVPPPLVNEMKRLAGKQATLMNAAERISAKFQTNDAANAKMLEAMTLMGRVKKDLEAYRYKNVLRARDETIGAIRQSKELLTGKIDVSADTSSNMPKYIMDDISDAMKGKLPDEYREVLKQYYQRLSEDKQPQGVKNSGTGSQ